MSVGSRVNWVAQQRVDLHHMLMQESFTAFDFRSIVTGIVGTDKSYVLRGFEVVGKTGLSIQVKVADSLVYNPRDPNGSFYLGLPDDENITVDLPADQANVFVEGRFRTVSQAPLNQAFWDPITLTGEEAGGTEFSASTNSQVITVLEISVNTVGFSEGAVKIARFATSASAIIDGEDRRELLTRLATGGDTPDPLHKYEWATSRGEPVPNGIGVGDAVDSPWRARDGSGALNDKAFRSLKDWMDAVMTRIAETSGSALWYASGISTSPTTDLSLNQVFFDTLGHSIQPSPQSSFIWKRVSGSLRLAGEGTVPVVSGSHHVGLIKWQANFSKLEWHLGGAFASGTFRNYAVGSIRFTSPAPDDKGNVYLKLERETPKGSGASVSWGDNSAEPAFDVAKSVSGNAGDFTGIALGDYIRKESEGYSRYYRVVKMSDGSTIYDNAVVTDENRIADSTIVAFELELRNSGDVLAASSEPLRYFRSRYSDADLYADQNIATNGYLYQSADFYWLGRRAGSLFILRGYGNMQENEEALTLDDSFGLAGAGDGGLVLEHTKQAFYDASTGYSLKTGGGDLITIRRRKRDNTVETPGGGDNSGALLTYTIAAPVGLMSVGDQLWVRLSDTTSGALVNGPVTNTTDELDNTDVNTNKWEVRPASTTPIRTRDDRDVFLLARRVAVGGQAALVFMDGTILGAYGRLINENVEITGETKLTPRTQQGILFISDTIAGQVDDDAAQLFYNKTTGTVGLRNFRITDSNVLLSTPGSVNFLTNLGSNTLVVGGALSTTYIPGDLVVAGNTVAVQVSQIQSEDKVISLGVGNLLNEGYNSGIEVADNTINATNLASTNLSPDVVVSLASAPGYALADIIGLSTTIGVGGITAGQLSGQYTIVASLTSAGDATISGSTLTVRTAAPATSTASVGTTLPKVFKAEWAFKVAGADGSLIGITSWMFQVKGVATKPTLTPVASYGIVPTAHSTNMQAGRIPFVNDDNAGPAGADTTFNFSANLTWNNATNTFSVTGNLVPGADDTYDLGTSLLQWRMLYLGPSNDSGITAGGDTNLYRPSANYWKTDDSFELLGNHYIGGFSEWTQQSAVPAAPAATKTRLWADDDGLVYQRTPDGDQKLLTNVQGNVYHEDVDVVTSPSGNNQMAPLPSPPTPVTLPKDRNKLIGQTLLANVTIGLATVTVTKQGHGLLSGETVTVVATSPIGGISAGNLSQTNATVTVVDADHFQYTAGASASSTASGFLDLVTATSIHYYVVGSQDLEVYLNGQLLRRGDDWTEVGGAGTLSNIITVNQTLVQFDVVTYRIDSNGGQLVINANSGSTLQGAYNAGNIINVVTGVPVTINGASGKLLVVNGDITVTGVIDPSGITFSPQGLDPLSGTDYGLWVDTATKDLHYKRAAGSAINLVTDFVRRDGTSAATAALDFGGFKGVNLANGTNPADAVNFSQLSAATALLADYIRRDGSNAPTADMNGGGFRYTNLGNPVGAQDATTKGYVDSLFENRNFKNNARAGTTTALPASTYNNGGGTITGSVNGALPAQDGVTLGVGESLLVKNQLSQLENGLYTVTVVGDGSTQFVLTRRLDANTGTELQAAYVIVSEGTTLADIAFVQKTDNVTLGVSPIVWEPGNTQGLFGYDMISLVGGLISVDLAANAGLVSTAPASAAGQLQVNTDESTVERSGNVLRVKDLGITAAKLAADSVTTAKILDANVTNAKLAADSVTTAKILDANVTNAKLAADSVTTAKILDLNVTTAKIADLNVTTAKIADLNVTTAKIADLNVTTGKIADDAVTKAKIAVDVAGSGMAQAADGSLQTRNVLIPLTNNTGVTIPLGTIVRLTGTGQIIPARANTLANSKATVGVAFEAIPDGQTGLVAVSGRVTVVGATLTPNEFVFLSQTTPGDATMTPPTDADVGQTIVKIGLAVTATEVILGIDFKAEIQA